MSLASMKARLNYQGGAVRQDRMIRDKLRSMLAATRNSYQAARFLKYPEFEQSNIGLFNPITQNQNFDTKMISVPFEGNYRVGDIFRWTNTETVWIIFLRDLTELAYFRGECRRCDHQVHWVDENQDRHFTYVSVIGPSNPSLRGVGSTQLTMGADLPTGSIRILVQDNERNRAFFHRYQHLLFQGIAHKVENLDVLSMPGVIQLYATEDYVNKIENDVEENIRNAWNVLPVVNEHPTSFMIEGPQVIKPFEKARFNVLVSGGQWIVIENQNIPARGHKVPVNFIENDHFQQEITVTWDTPRSGNFTLGVLMPTGQIHQRHIIVESLV